MSVSVAAKDAPAATFVERVTFTGYALPGIVVAPIANRKFVVADVAPGPNVYVIGAGTVLVPAGVPESMIVPVPPARVAPNVRSTVIGTVVWPGNPLTLAGVAVIAACATVVGRKAVAVTRRSARRGPVRIRRPQ